ncbi:DUF177 domain-containing protein [Skermanella sp. TT6]|uniref:DUF177 domain-containing protein n=1 Tax=Skermanella cutis TaxID=2775420 RepID=A0ABX7B325_9PROT|nr:DUF177 domain-containing protein [Skermanella sp. TT6]QQP88738.1 DUF177 domain-containing protein [Skermanella sp. TT6]
MTDQPTAAPSIGPEFSRTVLADKVSGDETTQSIKANPQECRRLAARLDLRDLKSLTATVRLKRVGGGQMIRVRGTLEADVVQTCVVTLEPVENHVADEFETMFAPRHLIPEIPMEVEIDPDAEEPPEPLVGNRIDIGELTAQHLSLALDPYPRRPGIAFEDHIEDAPAEGGDEVPAERPNPFLTLAKLKRPH